MSGIATAIYSVRNIGKVNNGDVGRLPAAVAQTTNVAGQGVNIIANKVNELGHLADASKNVSGVATRVSGLASKVTNPLLVCAAGVRVAKDDDKESALVEESLAMGGMFAAEKMYKIVRNTVRSAQGETIIDKTPRFFKETSTLGKMEGVSKKINTYTLKEGKLADVLCSLGKKIKGLSKPQKIAVFVAAELGLVATSILSYSGFKKIGQMLTGRLNNNKEEVQETEKEETFDNPAFTSLTVSK